MAIKWVIQKNLLSESSFDKIVTTLERSKNSNIIHPIIVKPFTDEWRYDIPIDYDGLTFYYGSTTMVKALWRRSVETGFFEPGLFFHPKKFRMSNYIDHWGYAMLNSSATIIDVANVKNLRNPDRSPIHDEQLVFIRPDDDSKSFSGHVIEFGKILEWLDNENFTNREDIGNVLIGLPYNIETEWRLFVVNGRLITWSKYKEKGKLSTSLTAPVDLLYKARQWIKQYQPAEAFVMDVGLCGGNYYIIECGCINAAGFYDAHLPILFTALGNHLYLESEIRKVINGLES